jgi:hypothetical protein
LCVEKIEIKILPTNYILPIALFTLLNLSVTLELNAQGLDNYEIKQITLPDQHSNRTVTDLYLDHCGVMWIASEGGLFVNTGTKIFCYAPNELDQFPDQEIRTLAEDDKGYLWVWVYFKLSLKPLV